MAALTVNTASRFLLLILLLTRGNLSYSQSTVSAKDTMAFSAFVHKIQKAYADPHCLEFKLGYYYANAGNPNLYIDSLKGAIQMDGRHSRIVLDGTATVLTNHYVIQVMEEDKTIYLATPRHLPASDPVSMLDSIFAHIDGIETTIRQEERKETLLLVFPPGQAYSSLEIQIDPRTGFLRKVDYSLNTASLVGAEMIDRPGNHSPYQSRGRMVILFSEYRKGGFDDRVLRDETYINKIAAGHFEPAALYKDYHIYLASSNL